MRTAETERPGAGKFGFSISCCSLGSQSAEHQPLSVTLKISPGICVGMSPNLRNTEKKTKTKTKQPGKGLGYQRDKDSSFLWVLLLMEPPRPRLVSYSLVRICRKRAKCWLWEPGTVTVGIPGRKASRERAESQTDCPAQSLHHSWHITTTKSWPEQDSTPETIDKPGAKFRSSAPLGQPECWPECYEKCTLSAVLSHGWEFMAEESFRAKLSKGFREGRIMVRPELWYQGLRVETQKWGGGMSVWMCWTENIFSVSGVCTARHSGIYLGAREWKFLWNPGVCLCPSRWSQGSGRDSPFISWFFLYFFPVFPQTLPPSEQRRTEKHLPNTFLNLLVILWVKWLPTPSARAKEK